MEARTAMYQFARLTSDGHLDGRKLGKDELVDLWNRLERTSGWNDMSTIGVRFTRNGYLKALNNLKEQKNIEAEREQQQDILVMLAATTQSPAWEDWAPEARERHRQILITHMMTQGSPIALANAQALVFMAAYTKDTVKAKVKEVETQLVYLAMVHEAKDQEDARFFVMSAQAYAAWKSGAETRELDQLTNMGVFGRTLKHVPAGTPSANIIRGFFVYNPIKEKARLVMADTQRSLDKEVKTTPTAAPSSLPFLLIYAVAHGWEIDVADVTAAYLTQTRRPGDEPMYLRLKNATTPDEVREIVKACYGLQESGRIWYDAFLKELTGLGFEPTITDSELMTNKENLCLLLKHVDDTISASPWSNTQTNGQRTIAEINKIYPMKTTNGHEFLGLNIDYDREARTLKLYADTAITRMSEQFLMRDFPVHRKPVVHAVDEAATVLTGKEHREYQGIVGSIHWLAQQCRYDCLYEATALSQRSQTPTERDMKTARLLLGYMRTTKDAGLFYDYAKMDLSKGIEVWTDASHASKQDDLKNMSGCVITMYGMTIHGATKTQPRTTTSATEAEAIACMWGANRALLAHNTLTEVAARFKMGTVKPIKIHSDCLPMIQLVKYGGKVDTKHINLKIRTLKGMLEDGHTLDHVYGRDQRADQLTKHRAQPDWTALGMSTPSDTRV
jgi:hypothetical protein